MELKDKIFIAGHRGLVGSAILRQLKLRGFSNIITRTHQELDLTNQSAVQDFFKTEEPVYVILAAGKGTRMGQVDNNLNKALLPIKNKAVISHIIDFFPTDSEFVVAVGHKSQQVIDYLAAAHFDLEQIHYLGLHHSLVAAHFVLVLLLEKYHFL